MLIKNVIFNKFNHKNIKFNNYLSKITTCYTKSYKIWIYFIEKRMWILYENSELKMDYGVEKYINVWGLFLFINFFVRPS